MLALLLLSGTARAQLQTMREHVRNMDSGRFGIGVDSSVLVHRTDAAHDVLVAPTFDLSYRLGEAVFEAALPVAYLKRTENEQSLQKLALGNPFLSVAYLPDCSCGLSRLSAGVGIPLADAGDALRGRALNLARASRGDWDGYVWSPNIFPLVVGASTLMERRTLRLAWDGDLIFGLPAGARAFAFGVQNAGDLAWLLGRRVRLGGRIHAVYFPVESVSAPDDSRLQAALSAYLRVSWPTFWTTASYLVNLDRFADVAPGFRDMLAFGVFVGGSF
jgi:hypothetical protein